jgi:tetratricopeptide (TPR) repeat protein
MLNLGLALDDAGRTAEAVELGRASLQIRRDRYGPEHTAVANGMMTLAQWLADTGANEEAETLLRDALAMRERLLGAGHPDVALSRLALANHLADDGRMDQACGLGDGIVTVLGDALGADHWRVAVARGLEGACLLAAGRLEDAEASLLKSLERLEAETGARADLKRQTLRRLIQLYEEWNRLGDAQKYQQLLSTAAGRQSP